MANAVEEDLVDWIDTQVGDLAAFTQATNLFEGPVRAAGATVPHEALFVLATGGDPPLPFLGTTVSYCVSALQVRYRSAPHEYAAGRAKVRAVRNAIHLGSITGYVEVRVRESEPLYLGPDEHGSHEWAINVDMEHRR